VAEKGANMCLGEAAERRQNISLGAALEVECVTGTATDGFVQVKECAVELATAAEGDAQVGASIVEQMHTLPSAWRCLGSLSLVASHISWRAVVMIGCVV